MNHGASAARQCLAGALLGLGAFGGAIRVVKAAGENAELQKERFKEKERPDQ